MPSELTITLIYIPADDGFDVCIGNFSVHDKRNVHHMKLPLVTLPKQRL